MWTAPAKARQPGRYIFCATVLQVTLTGRYPAHCPAEFGLSSRPSRSATAGGRLAHCEWLLYIAGSLNLVSSGGVLLRD